ncbi:hypothetical protein B4168_3851 [Anoxybacillus flavithermus]|nr:hypothetical protein B4168_3851 [Anoxybacillus flavithermus]OAO87965.1 hypothetical protein GT23_0698 [Parageobacillus thermoglucosidasius]
MCVKKETGQSGYTFVVEELTPSEAEGFSFMWKYVIIMMENCS